MRFERVLVQQQFNLKTAFARSNWKRLSDKSRGRWMDGGLFSVPAGDGDGQSPLSGVSGLGGDPVQQQRST